MGAASGVEGDGTNTQEICFRQDVVGAWKVVSKVYRSEDGRGNSFLRKPKSSALLLWEWRGEEGPQNRYFRDSTRQERKQEGRLCFYFLLRMCDYEAKLNSLALVYAS